MACFKATPNPRSLHPSVRPLRERKKREERETDIHKKKGRRTVQLSRVEQSKGIQDKTTDENEAESQDAATGCSGPDRHRTRPFTPHAAPAAAGPARNGCPPPYARDRSQGLTRRDGDGRARGGTGAGGQPRGAAPHDVRLEIGQPVVAYQAGSWPGPPGQMGRRSPWPPLQPRGGVQRGCYPRRFHGRVTARVTALLYPRVTSHGPPMYPRVTSHGPPWCFLVTNHGPLVLTGESRPVRQSGSGHWHWQVHCNLPYAEPEREHAHRCSRRPAAVAARPASHTRAAAGRSARQ